MAVKNKAVEKISDLIQNYSREEYERIMFPKKESYEYFKQIIKYEQKKRDDFIRYDSVKKKIEILTHFFMKLEAEKVYDPKFDRLHEDPYRTTRKIDRGNNIFDNLTKIWDKKVTDSDIETICQAYAQSYERFCKRYLRSLASKIKKKNIKQCGIAIDIIADYDEETGKIIKSCLIPQIRNSVDHSDYDFDNKTNKISFDDDDKTTIEFTPEQLKTLIHFVMENESCFSIAAFQIKEPLLKAIIVESEKCMKLCKILGIEFDDLMAKYLSKGYSLFEINWRIEQYLSKIKKRY